MKENVFVMRSIIWYNECIESINGHTINNTQ